MKAILISRDSKGLVRFLKLESVKFEDFFRIIRSSGVLGGKEVVQPELLIREGKAKRTVEQQVELEFNALVKKALDKGYKFYDSLSSKAFEEASQEDFSEILGEHKTDASGIKKPMLAKDTAKITPDNKLWRKKWFASRKYDGVRCMLYWDDKSKEVKTASRGGLNYDAATSHIRNNNEIKEYFSRNTTMVLDGEIYVHGHSLQEISGTARLDEFDEKRCSVLEYHCYDVAVEKIPFKDRVQILNEISEILNGNSVIKFVDHCEITSYEEAKRLHDQWVNEGYEGAILRNPDDDYGFGKRSSSMIKLKEFKEEEFEIIGHKLGLRGSEDMVFVLKTKSGIEFEAKPIGDRSKKEDYVNNIDSIVGRFGTVKYFNLTDDGTPFLPVFKVVRDYE